MNNFPSLFCKNLRRPSVYLHEHRTVKRLMTDVFAGGNVGPPGLRAAKATALAALSPRKANAQRNGRVKRAGKNAAVRTGRPQLQRQPAQKTASTLALARQNSFMLVRDLSQTRHTLLQRLKDCGDDACWQDFFDTYWRLIYTTAIRAQLSPEEAEDVVQETMRSIERNIKKFKVGRQYGRFKPFLLRMTNWRIKDQKRKRPLYAASYASSHEETGPLPDIDELPDPGSLEPDVQWQADWQQNLINSAVERIKTRVDPLDYQMFDLHVLKLWTASKVAALLNVKIGRVFSAKYNILRLIRKEVARLETELI
jgi:RNA polymerase sigma factor (sigma-70 family)